MRTTGFGQSALLLLDAVDVLTREKIDYAVIGAMAASIHGVVRASIDVPFRGMSLRVIGQEDFVAMKLFAGGPRGLADAANAVSVAGSSLDVDLVRRLAKRYGRDAEETLRKVIGG